MTTIAAEGRHRPAPWGIALAVAIALELTYFTLTTRHFAEHGHGMLVLTEQFMPTGVLALGAALVILTGNIDLSSGAVASLSAIVVGTQLQSGASIAAAVVVGIGVATAVGMLNGAVISLLRIDSLLVTLATQFIASSVATSIGGENPPYNFPKTFLRLGTGTVAGIPIALVVFAVLAVVTMLLVTRTVFGRSLVLIGYNRSAADYSGIPATRVLMGVFTLSGFAAGVGGVLLAAFYNAARADSGTTLLLPAITIVVLGGVDIFGGRGRIGEVVLAVFLLGYLTQGLLIEGYSSLTATMVTGLLLIVALVLKVWLGRAPGQSLQKALRESLRRRLRPAPS